MQKHDKQPSLQIGQLFGYWQVIGLSESSRSYYECLCTGCNKTTRSIRKWNLLNRQSSSCGCKKIDVMIDTNKQKYGCEFVQQNQDIKDKGAQTILDRYGVESYSQTLEFIEKCRQTCNENWGSDHHTKSPKWRLAQQPKYGMVVLGMPLGKRQRKSRKQVG